MADYSLHLLLHGNLAVPQGHISPIFSSNLLIRSCLCSHIPLGPPLTIPSFPVDANLPLHFYHTNIYFPFGAYAIQLNPSDSCPGASTLEWVTQEWREWRAGLSLRHVPPSTLSLQWLLFDHLGPWSLLHFKSCHHPGVLSLWSYSPAWSLCSLMLAATVTTASRPYLYLGPSQWSWNRSTWEILWSDTLPPWHHPRLSALSLFHSAGPAPGHAG